MTIVRSIISVAALSACILLTTAAQAQLSFTFISDTLSGIQNQSLPLTFQIHLTNDVDPSFIDGIQVQFDNSTLPSGLIDISPFINNPNIPTPLPSDYDTPNLDFFTVNLTGVDAGSYSGTAIFSFDTDGVTLQTASAGFQVDVTPAAAPEPTTFSFLSLVLLFLLPLARRKSHYHKGYRGAVISIGSAYCSRCHYYEIKEVMLLANSTTSGFRRGIAPSSLLAKRVRKLLEINIVRHL